MATFHERSPLAFAHRGGRAHFRENTLDAFRHAISSGIRAIETDAWLSGDGKVVLDHDGKVRTFFRLRARSVGRIAHSALPKHIPTLAELCDLVGPDVDVQIDVKGRTDIASAVVETWRAHLPSSMHRLWLAHDGYRTSKWRRVAQWRELDNDIRLVDSTTLRRFDLSVSDYAARAKQAGIDVINLRASQWRVDLVNAVHSEGLQAFAFNAQKPEAIQRLLRLGVDGVYSDHVDRLLAALEEFEA